MDRLRRLVDNTSHCGADAGPSAIGHLFIALYALSVGGSLIYQFTATKIIDAMPDVLMRERERRNWILRSYASMAVSVVVFAIVYQRYRQCRLLEIIGVLTVVHALLIVVSFPRV